MQVGSVQAKTTSLIVQPAKAAKASSLAYYNPADTDKGGVVSAAEALVYALKYPELSAHKAGNAASTHSAQSGAVRSVAPYSQRGTVNGSPHHGLLDLKA